MFEQLVDQLKSADAAERREAIIGLGKLADPRALSHLAQVYKTDSDPALRELAAKAGRHINKLSKAATPDVARESPAEATPARRLPDILAAYTKPPEPEAVAESASKTAEVSRPPRSNLPDILSAYTKPAAPPLSTPTPAPPTLPVKAEPPEIELPPIRPVSPQRRETARRRLNNAFAYKLKDDDHNAMVELAKALSLDPELRDDNSAQGLAASLVGGNGKDSLKIIMQRVAAEPPKPKAKAFDAEVLDVAIAALVLFGVTAVFSLILIYLIAGAVLAILPKLAQSEPDVAALQTALANLRLQDILPEVLRQAFLTMASTLFQIIIIYGVGTFMGGTGVVTRFLSILMFVSAAIYVLLSVALGALIIGISSGRLSTLVTTSQIALLLVIVSLLGGFVAEVYLTARIQKFSLAKAFGSVLVGSAAAGFIAGLLGLFNVQA